MNTIEAPRLMPRIDCRDESARLKLCAKSVYRNAIDKIEQDREELAEYEASLPKTDAEAIAYALSLLNYKSDLGPEGLIRACNAIGLLEAATYREDLFDSEATFEALVGTIRQANDDLAKARHAIETVAHVLSRPARHRAEGRHG